VVISHARGVFAITGALLPAAPALAQSGKALTVPVAGRVTDETNGQVEQVTGTFTITRFVSHGTGVDAAARSWSHDPTGQVVVPQVSMPLNPAANASTAAISAAASETCDVLDLVLGPLHLDLLGLVIDLNQVVRDITAQQGAGNLLGNLLCAITNLLNGTGSGDSSSQLAQLLNQLLGILGI
jgi:hypothetical protein